MLPRFAAAEDAARLAEVMSFALAACVVAERFAAIAGRAAAPGWRPFTDNVPESAVVGDTPPPRPFGALLLARLAGEAGLGWLGQEPAALRALAAYFGDGPSELRAIACEAERRIGLPLDRGPPASAPDAPPAEDAPADRPTAPQPQAATTEPEPAPGRAPPPRDRRRGRRVGVDQLGAGGAARRLPRSQRPRRVAAQLSRVRRTRCPRPASRRSPPDGTSARPRCATAWSGSGATARASLPRARPTSSAPCSPTAVASRAWCSRGSSSGTTIRRLGRTPGWSARAGDRPASGAPSYHGSAPPEGRDSPTRPRVYRATTRPADRHEAGGAPAIGIEARRAETRLRRGSVRSTRARPRRGIAPPTSNRSRRPGVGNGPGGRAGGWSTREAGR